MELQFINSNKFILIYMAYKNTGYADEPYFADLNRLFVRLPKQLQTIRHLERVNIHF